MIYMIGGDSFDVPFKVGYSKDVKRRVKDINTYTTTPVRLLAEFIVESNFNKMMLNQDGERIVHGVLASYRQHREWFKCPDLITFETALDDHELCWIDLNWTDDGFRFLEGYDDYGEAIRATD